MPYGEATGARGLRLKVKDKLIIREKERKTNRREM